MYVDHSGHSAIFYCRIDFFCCNWGLVSDGIAAGTAAISGGDIGAAFWKRFVEFMLFDGANTVSSTLFGIMYGSFDGAASLTKYLIEQEISKPTTASAFNY